MWRRIAKGVGVFLCVSVGSFLLVPRPNITVKQHSTPANQIGAAQVAFVTTHLVTDASQSSLHLIDIVSLMCSLRKRSRLVQTHQADLVVMTNLRSNETAILQQTAHVKILHLDSLRLDGGCVLAHNGSHHAKLQIWRLVQYTKIVFLDSDCLVVQSIDELFGLNIREGEVLGVPDDNPPMFLNSGVVVLRPSLHTWQHMLNSLNTMCRDPGGNETNIWWLSKTHGDQDFLQLFFSGNWTMLPFKYNFMQLVLTGNCRDENESRSKFILAHQDHPSFAIKVFHFTGFKPWQKPVRTWQKFRALWWDTLKDAVSPLSKTNRCELFLDLFSKVHKSALRSLSGALGVDHHTCKSNQQQNPDSS